ncbi:MAG TPA: xylulokinase [Phycisphaerae bacterium]|nr:xylulokinase [Phycisphaerae bacterium]
MTARDLVIGVDSGTQSTKVVLVDGETGEVVAAASVPHRLIEGLPPGHLEQRAEDWFTALEEALQAALADHSADPKHIRAIGVSGQQHGLVALDADGRVIRPAKLWCDTSTAKQCEEIIARVGGLARYIELTGNGLPPGFTASKLAWLKEREPANYARLRTVLLPHDYLNYRLTGLCRMEPGDASGTALLDVRRRTWCTEVIAAIDGALVEKLPSLMANDQPCGMLRKELADKWGLPGDVLVASGGGDNMMSAIGTGNVTDGVVTVSLGTSGTIFAYSSSPIVDPLGEIAAFCDSTGAWLPLICTMNVTVATELTKALFGLNNEQLDSAAARVPVGSAGLMLLPYFEGERTPNVPNGTGVWFGANRRTHTPAHFARAAMEGATLGLNYGLRRLRELGVADEEIRLTGGGANSAAWRRIAADVFNRPVVCLAQTEAAAFGAAMQAAWCWQKQRLPQLTISRLAERWIVPLEQTRVLPNPRNAERYARLQRLHDRLSIALRESFDMHREIALEGFEGGRAGL